MEKNVTVLWLDTETYSEVDLFKAGLHRYAEDPSTEITVAQWAVGDGEPVVCDITTMPRPFVPADLRFLLEDPNVIIKAHNAQFDRTILRHVWGIDIPVERWRCTMVQAMVHGLPGALGKLGPILGMPVDLQKDRRGDKLVKMFCKPNPANWKTRRNTRHTHPKEWQEFLEYSRQDIVSMREMASRLPTWNWKEGGRVQKLWFLDQHINDRGFAVDVELAQAAVEATKEEKARIDEEMHDATDGEVSGASKRADLLAHILMEYGVVLKDTKADTLRKCMDDPDLPEGVKLLIALRLEGTKTSTAKYASLLRAVCRDHRLRGGLQFSGAQRTMRWAGRLFQPQNLARGTMPKEEVALGIQALKARVAGYLW